MNTRVARTLGLMLLASLALALPASASAAGILYSGGSEVPTGTKIVGTQNTSIQFKSGGTQVIECSKASLNGNVRTNDASRVQLTVEGLTLSGWKAENRCASGLALGDVAISLEGSACWQHSSKLQWTWNGSACGVESTATRLRMAFEVSGVTCIYRRTSTIALESNINSEPLAVGVPAAGQEFLRDPGGSVFCPPSLVMYSLLVKLQTSSGGGLKVTS
jgi:hypothetical protein